MSGVRVARVTVSVGEVQRAIGLYSGALGLTVLYRNDDMAMLQFADEPATQLLLHRRTPAPTPAGVAVSFLVGDVDAATEAACAAGAQVIDRPSDQSWGERQAVLNDLDGHILCLVAPLAS